MNRERDPQYREDHRSGENARTEHTPTSSEEAESRGRLSHHEVADVEKRLRLRAPVIYHIVAEEGEEELTRPAGSLFWSGLAAGLAISMSLVSEAILRHELPDTEWRPLVESFGYCVGFLVVVLGRLQLFTENTITAVLPLMRTRSRRNIVCMLRLWSVVFAANMLGTLLFALSAVYSGIFPAAFVASAIEISQEFMAKTPAEMLLHGVPAGFLVAAMVWMLPSAHRASFWVITLMTYLIAVGEFAHVVAGSAEAFILWVDGAIGAKETFLDFMLPTFIGNVIGGTALFTLLAYGQVKEEI